MNFSNFQNSDGFAIAQHFASKNLDELSIEELAYVHLNRTHQFTTLKNAQLSSSLYDLIETAQASSINSRTRIYTPMLACFAVLDQIGGAYGLSSVASSYQNGIKVALDVFGSYSKKEIEYLTNLRNGLYHDGSLLSISNNGKTKAVYRLDPEGKVTVTLPKNEWDGVYRDSLSDYITKINVLSLKSDVERISKKCLGLLLQGQLVMHINSPREFFYKFLFASEKSA